jgi:hypothetical protein
MTLEIQFLGQNLKCGGVKLVNAIFLWKLIDQMKKNFLVTIWVWNCFCLALEFVIVPTMFFLDFAFRVILITFQTFSVVYDN